MILKKWWFWALVVVGITAIVVPIVVVSKVSNSVQSKIDRIMKDDSLSNKEKIDKLYALNNQTATRTTSTEKYYTTDDIWNNMTNETGSNYHTQTNTSTSYGNASLIMSYVETLQEDMPAPDKVYLKYNRFDSYYSEHEISVYFDMTYAGFKDVYYYDYDLGGPSGKFYTKFTYNGTSKTIQFDNGESGYSSIYGKRSGNLFHADRSIPSGVSEVTIDAVVHPYSGDKNGFSYYREAYYSYHISFNPAILQSQNTMAIANPTISYSMPSGYNSYY